MSDIILVTGKINSGKTIFLQRLIESFSDAAAFRTAGFIAEGIYSNEEKTGFILKGIHEKKSCLICSDQPRQGWQQTGRFYFNPEGIAFGEILLTALPERTGLIIIDELGPLELEGKGWHPAILRLLSTHPDKTLLFTVRTEILKPVIQYFAGNRIAVFDITRGEKRQIIRKIHKILYGRFHFHGK